jgi:PKD repeat protein
MLFLIVIALDFGRSMLALVALNNATRLAANYASLHPTAWTGTSSQDATYRAEYASLVTDDFRGMGCPAPAPVPTPVFPNGTALGAPVSVVFRCDMPLITPLVGNLFPSSGVPIGAESVFLVRGGVINTAGGGGGNAPVVSCSATPTDGPAPLTVSITYGTTGGTVTHWSWDFGDGTGSFSENPGTHTYSTPSPPGIPYIVDLTAENTWGSATCSFEVSVEAPPELAAAFTWVPNPATAASSIQFTGSASGGTAPYTWSWMLGAGAGTSTVQSPTHTYATASTYTVTLTVTDSVGGTATATHDVVVTPQMCVVPNFIGAMTNKVQGDWTTAGFGTTVNFTPYPPPNYKVKTQTQSPGASLLCASTQIQVSNP